jgi:hypothetical protein
MIIDSSKLMERVATEPEEEEESNFECRFC